MTSSFAQSPIVFVDLETTGANFANDRIIEIGIVAVDKEGVHEWSSLVNPDQPIPPFITGLTGIDSTMVESAPRFEELAPIVFEKLRGHLFVAHNARFDYTFLKREFLRLGMTFRASNLCTVKLSRRLFPVHHRHSLDALVVRHDIQVADRHRALADAKVLWDLWQCWQAQVPAEQFEHEVATIVGRYEFPPQIDPAIADDLPESPGAYAFYDEDGRQLLVKRSSNIRQQVLAHFAPTNRDSLLVRNVCRIDWRESAGELGARLHEKLLGAPGHHPSDDLCAWKLVQRGAGDFKPELVFARDSDFAVEPNLFGLYQTRREAVNSLRKLVEAHHLCHSHVGIGTGKPGEPCVGYKQRTCRGVCIGKESVSLHSARLMSALAKFKVTEWPYSGPVALVERDEFGMREDWHVFDRWRFLGTAHSDSEVSEILGSYNDMARNAGGAFDADIYRLVSKVLKAGKTRVRPLA